MYKFFKQLAKKQDKVLFSKSKIIFSLILIFIIVIFILLYLFVIVNFIETEIQILNLHSHPKQGDNWEVGFITKGRADLKIIPNDQATINDDEFVSLSCGNKILEPEILENNIIYFEKWKCDETSKVIHYTKKKGKHILRFEFGDKEDWAYNASSYIQMEVQKFTDIDPESTGWTAKSFLNTYDTPVVILTAEIPSGWTESADPAFNVNFKSLTSSGLDIMITQPIDNYGSGSLSDNMTVYMLVVEAGYWDASNSDLDFAIEAMTFTSSGVADKSYNSTVLTNDTVSVDLDATWGSTSHRYFLANSVDNEVAGAGKLWIGTKIFGSTASKSSEAGATQTTGLRIGLSSGEATSFDNHADETIHFVVIEDGTHSLDGQSFRAFHTADGPGDYSDSGNHQNHGFGETPVWGIVTQLDEDGGDGGHPLWEDSPFGSTQVICMSQEDREGDTDYNHTTEEMDVFIADTLSWSYSEVPVNTAPTGSFVSATQKTDGSGDVDISVEIDDDDDNDTKLKLAYESDSSCDSFSDLTLDEGVGASADNNDSGGAPSLENNDVYQVGTTATYRVITSSGSNTVEFDWNSATDQGSGNATMCLQLTTNDDTADQATPATQTLTIDNVNPATPGNLTENNRQANQITLDYGSVSSDTNDPGTNNYRLFYKLGTSGVAETDTEWNDVDFDAWDYGGASGNTTVTGLTANQDYVFNIWAYDTYCQTSVESCTQNKTAATEVTLKTRIGNFDAYASSSQSFDEESIQVLFTSQTSTMTDAGAIKIEDDRGSDAGWSLNLTANDWKIDTETMQLDYNGTGSDDNLGKMCADPASATLYVETGSLTNVNKGTKDCFSGGVSTIDLVTADADYGTGTYWLTDLSLEQYIPANPTAAVYTTTIILTIQ